MDSQSSDNTKEVASQILTQNNIKHVIINKKCSISEGRNICFEVANKFSIEYVLFIDADVVILDANLLQKCIQLSVNNNETVFFINAEPKNFYDKEAMEGFLLKVECTKNQYILKDVAWCGTGLFFIKNDIFNKIRFQEDMNFLRIDTLDMRLKVFDIN